MSESQPTISVPLYGTKEQIWKIVLAARPKRPVGRKVETLIFIACHWAMIDFVTGTNKERFSHGALVRAVEKLMCSRKEWLNRGGAIAVPHVNTLKRRCRDWLIWRASKPDNALKAIRRTNVRQTLINLRYTCEESIWMARYCETEMPDRLKTMGALEWQIKWHTEQARVTKLVRSLPLIAKHL